MVFPDCAFVGCEVLFNVGFVVEERGIEDPCLAGGSKGSIEFVDGITGVREAVKDTSTSDECVRVGEGWEVVNVACPELDGGTGRAGERATDLCESVGCVGCMYGNWELSGDENGEVTGAGTDV